MALYYVLIILLSYPASYPEDTAIPGPAKTGPANLSGSGPARRSRTLTRVRCVLSGVGELGARTQSRLATSYSALLKSRHSQQGLFQLLHRDNVVRGTALVVPLLPPRTALLLLLLLLLPFAARLLLQRLLALGQAEAAHGDDERVDVAAHHLLVVGRRSGAAAADVA